MRKENEILEYISQDYLPCVEEFCFSYYNFLVNLWIISYAITAKSENIAILENRGEKSHIKVPLSRSKKTNISENHRTIRKNAENIESEISDLIMFWTVIKYNHHATEYYNQVYRSLSESEA